jgi:hypothetical protein
MEMTNKKEEEKPVFYDRFNRLFSPSVGKKTITQKKMVRLRISDQLHDQRGSVVKHQRQSAYAPILLNICLTGEPFKATTSLKRTPLLSEHFFPN